MDNLIERRARAFQFIIDKSICISHLGASSFFMVNDESEWEGRAYEVPRGRELDFLEKLESKMEKYDGR